MIEKFLHIGKNLSKVRQKFGLFQIQLGFWEESKFQENFAIFPLLNLEIVLPALKLTRNCLKWTFFFMKTGNLIISWVSLLFKHTVPANKIWNQWGFKLFSESRKIWKCNIGLLYLKNPHFLFFSWIATFKNLEISLLIGKNLEVQA